MIAEDYEIQRLAQEMIARHGPRAAVAATERLNEMIDRNNHRGREIWACVVHVIHRTQGSGPVWAKPETLACVVQPFCLERSF